ncbi:MAG TPA: transcriptional antiterminator, Rof [Gammaproteobacteria bacterium]|nr:transcriptional antiterminator, Rof [Gammaproteobacteria bacterium]
MTDDDSYRPIDCGRHSELELAIMHRQWLRVAWHEDGGSHVEALLPRDLETREGVEYLLADNHDGTTHRIRLDRLDEFQPIEFN